MNRHSNELLNHINNLLNSGMRKKAYQQPNPSTGLQSVMNPDILQQMMSQGQMPGGMMQGGMPPMDPSMMQGGMPPMDPSMMQGGMPPMDPSMMQGGMPPMDPSMMQGGMPPMDPSMMQGGMPSPEQMQQLMQQMSQQEPEEANEKESKNEIDKINDRIKELETSIKDFGGKLDKILKFFNDEEPTEEAPKEPESIDLNQQGNLNIEEPIWRCARY